MTHSFFVSPSWLAEHLNDNAVQIVDARMLPPGQEQTRNIGAEYLAQHLPDAPFFDIEALSDRNSLFPHMLPRAEWFAVAMRERGINSDRHLVVYDEGNLFSAPRAWWMLRQYGAGQVSVLAGGLKGWQEAGLPLAAGEVSLPTGRFSACAVTDAVASVTDVLLLSHEGGAQIIDARAANRFRGEVDEPRQGIRRGRIPGSLNVPWNELVENGELKSPAVLKAIFQQHGVNPDEPVVASCGSGVTATVVILALTTLGATNVRLYDGAWAEWGSRDDLPIVLG